MNDSPAGKGVTLRDTETGDLAVLFEQQRDPEANEMAAFTVADPDDRAAFMTRWERLLADHSILLKTILFEGQIAGSIGSYVEDDRIEVSYWLGRDFWGRGIATRALIAFLQTQTKRPLYARVAQDNRGSIRVLEKCGFQVVSRETGYANARRREIAELVLRLDSRQ